MVHRGPVLLSLLALPVASVHSPNVCEDRLGAECSAFSTMARETDTPKVAWAAQDDDRWKMHVINLDDAAMLARFHRSNKQSMVLFHAPWDTGEPARNARIAFAGAASGTIGAEAAVLDAADSLRFAAVGCELGDKTFCNDFTAGGNLLPAVWCFANGNWTEGPPIRLSLEREVAATTAASLSTRGILDFAARCVAAWDGHADQIRASRYVSSRAVEADAQLPPPLASRRLLDHDRPPSMLRGIRDKSESATPKKAMEMEYIPHVSENQDRLPRSFRSSDENRLDQHARAAPNDLHDEEYRHKAKKLKKSSVILEGSGMHAEGQGSGRNRGSRVMDRKVKDGTTAAMRRVDENIRETAEERRARRVQEIIAKKAQKKKEAKEAAEAAMAKARQPPASAPIQPSQPPRHESESPSSTKAEMNRDADAISSTSRDKGDRRLFSNYRVSSEMPPDLSSAAQRAAAVHGPLDTSGLARLLSGVDMGGYAEALSELGVGMPQDLKRVSDEQLQSLGMRPAEQRKLRKISEKVVVQGQGQEVRRGSGHTQHAGGGIERKHARKHTDL